MSPVSIPNHVNDYQKFHNKLIIITELRIITDFMIIGMIMSTI